MCQVGVQLPPPDKLMDMMRPIIIFATDMWIHLTRTGKCTSMDALKRISFFSLFDASVFKNSLHFLMPSSAIFTLPDSSNHIKYFNRHSNILCSILTSRGLKLHFCVSWSDL